MKQHLSTELKQTQRLTPLQVQFVRMLEMTGPEMEDEVQRALDEMPALEAAEEHGDENTATVNATEDGDDFTETPDDMQRADFRSDDDIPDYLSPADSPVTRGIRHRQYDGNTNLPEQGIPADGEGLTERLMAQVSELDLDSRGRMIARHIVGSIDPNGYMTRLPEALADDIAIDEGIDVSTDEMQRIWQLVRGFDPAGVGATDLRDCLLLQLARMPRTAATLTAIEILTNHFDYFAKKHYSRIATRLGITTDDVNAAAEVIRRLDPKPGGGVTDGRLEHGNRGITPDFSVEVTENGQLALTLLNRLPELRIEATFAEDPAAAQTGNPRLEEARAFIRTKREDARNFIKTVGMRQQTLFNVMSAIVKLQRRFFITEADEDIAPMVLKDISAITGYNLSVISRATQGKYVATARGVYPLKKFFNERIRTDDDSVTANKVMAVIRAAIEKENKNKPLSDREIAAILEAEGLDIARRTVAKYREAMGLQVARLRKTGH